MFQFSELDSSPDKKHRHHKKHTHKKHKKHRRGKETSEAEEGSTEQEIELDQIEYSMDMIHEEAVTIPSEEHFLMDAEHCEVCSLWSKTNLVALS